ncbi:hypothetical protein FOL47_005244 [Perkinsus chesapeaki]|uniref:Uncharacterized protein n=1 Tax=Perkinsus chesapeaki TaxID=330153 RepID=A0A7J6LYJ6_PERCH|nr:hypothetical protein FOL47_005244 [Perkinsus chesapeaki]
MTDLLVCLVSVVPHHIYTCRVARSEAKLRYDFNSDARSVVVEVSCGNKKFKGKFGVAMERDELLVVDAYKELDKRYLDFLLNYDHVCGGHSRGGDFGEVHRVRSGEGFWINADGKVVLLLEAR